MKDRYIILYAMFLSINITYAQKLPNIQKGEGQLIPGNMSIDGKLKEWPNSLKAFNRATSLEYVLANDNDNLYLAVRSKDISATAKILAGGITLTINTFGKKIATGPSITFPSTNSGYTVTTSGVREGNFKILTDSAAITETIKQFKYIRVKNLLDVSDGELPIYNQEGINTKMYYENSSLTYEILIPRKNLGLIDFSKQFAYQIKLEGIKQPNVSPDGLLPPPSTPPPGRKPSDPLYILSEISTPTDLWGKYTLAK